MNDMNKIIEQRIIYTHLYNQYEGIYQKIAQNAGMAEIPYRVLYALCEDGKKWSQIDICREWNYAKQSVNTAISKLVKQGYVVLMQDKSMPRNHKIIVLTEQGQEFCNRWVRPVIDADNQAFAAMSEQERKMCIAIRKKHYEFVKNSLKDLLELSEEENTGE
ncbi:MarR family transcriptional regulator [Clostridiaceae bacterium NSJ-31]|uniref:MarR family transcriptional regulator n=1 Tax=Ligaoa zhengdingensis TaxID=2763658 RepID=A0A926I526_9FIRM|nr:MarR family transcriptional regulator [Ligaoa zhengdingensis]MBC8547010.1 MarR family transcriptional regulator [Ligaoa zhengdingensis]